jgi:hypothetical protein
LSAIPGTVSLKLRTAQGEQLYEVIDNESAFDQFETSRRHMLLGLSVEARTVSPSNPRLPDARHNPAKGSGWTHIFEKPD